MPELKNMQHERFCVEYLVDFNGTRSALAAGYKDGEGIRSQAYDLLTRPHIQQRVKELNSALMLKAQVSPELVLTELRRIAACDVGQAYLPDGSLKAIHDIPDDVRRCISAFEVEEIFEGQGEDRVYVGKLRKVKFWDKNKGLELLGKHFKLFTEKFEGSIELSLEKLIEGDVQRNEVRQLNEPGA